MSMSTHIKGFRPPDENWKKMKAAWDACRTAGVPIPEELHEFFNSKEPDPNGVEVEIPSATEWVDDSSKGLELKVSDIPPHVQVIRFYNSY